MGAHAQTRELIGAAAEVLAEYEGRITLRQLFYRLVAAQVIENSEAEYGRLGNAVKRAREEGIIPWEAIEDRLRRPTLWRVFRGLPEYVEAMAAGYVRDRRQGRPTYVEVWLEKDALRGVAEEVCARYHVPLMVTRGYASATATWEAAERIREALRDGAGTAAILYLGDFDPSGMNIPQVIEQRLEEHGVIAPPDEPSAVWLERLALTAAQVEEYALPPVPAKRTDTRARAFIGRHGDRAVELDALPPEVLEELIEAGIRGCTDEELMAEQDALGEGEGVRLADLCRAFGEER